MSVNENRIHDELRSLRQEMNAGFRELRQDIHDSLEVRRGWVTGAAAVIGAAAGRLWGWMRGRS